MSDGNLRATAGWQVSEPLDRPLTPEVLCANYAHRVYRFAAMVARGDVEAEDLAQDALLRAIRGLGQFDSARGSLEGWLWQIVMNAARDAGRISTRRQALWARLTTERPEFESTESIALDRFADRELLQAVRQLEKRDRELIALRFGADLDYAAVGRACGLRPAAATMAVRRALTRLRKHLEDQR